MNENALRFFVFYIFVFLYFSLVLYFLGIFCLFLLKFLRSQEAHTSNMYMVNCCCCRYT